MNFANMNPADRMKASGLIGLIVVIMFFVVHTMLGIVAPKKPTGPIQDGTSASPTAPGPPVPATGPTTGSPTTPGGEAQEFPTGRVVASKSSISKALQIDPGDPFIQLPHAKDKAAGGKPGPDRDVEMHPFTPPPGFDPMRPVGGIPSSESYGPGGHGTLGGLPALIPAGGANPLGPAPVAIPTPPQPEIKVVGIVHGDRSVATMEVGTRVMIARPGDALYPGWRMTAVTPDGVRIRHEGKTELLRVGSVLNDKSEKPEVKQQ